MVDKISINKRCVFNKDCKQLVDIKGWYPEMEGEDHWQWLWWGAEDLPHIDQGYQACTWLPHQNRLSSDTNQ